MARARFRSSRVAPESRVAPMPRVKRSRFGFGFGKLLFAMFILLLLALWFAPTIVLYTPLRDSLLGRALEGFPGKVKFSSASAGWFSPVVVNKLNVTDAEGQSVATAESIKTEKNLLSLLLESSRVGTIRLQQPQLNIVVRDNGNNLEDLLAPWLASSKSSQRVACVIEIIDGTVAVTHAPTNTKWSFAKVQARAEIPNDSSPLVAKMNADLVGDQQPPGNVACDIQWSVGSPAAVKVASTSSPAAQGSPAPGSPAAAPASTGLKPPASSPTATPSKKDIASTAATPGKNSVSFRSTSLPLDALNPWLRRFGLDIQFSGRLTSDVTVSQSDGIEQATIKSLVADKLFIASPQFLGPDQLQLASLTGAGEITRTKGVCQIRGAALKSEVANLEINGTVPIGQEAITTARLVQALRECQGELKGDIDVARLAAVLPHTLRIREGTQVSSGRVRLDVTSASQPSGHQWNANLEASDVAALHEGHTIQWRRPIVVKSVVSESATGISIDQLTCESSFLQLTGQGNWIKGQLTGNGDLDQFVREVGRFVDLGTLNAAGKVTARLAWNHDANQVIAVTGDATARDFQLTSQAMRPWREQQLQIDFSASAKTAERTITSLEQGDVEIKTAGDSLLVELRQAVAAPTLESNWPLHFKLQGDLGQWLARMQLFFAVPGWNIDGDGAELKGDANVSSRRVEVVSAEGTVKNLQVIGGGVFVIEPTMQFVTDGTYDFTQSEFSATKIQISGTTVALRADNVRFVNRPAGKISLDGTMQYRTDLTRLTGWLHDPQKPAPFRLAGATTGSLRMAHEGGVTNMDLTANTENFSYAVPVVDSRAGTPITALKSTAQTGRWQEEWKEPRLQMTFQGSYDAAADRLAIGKLEAAGEALSIGGAGSIRQPFTRGDLELSGQYAYDLERLSERLRGLLGPNVQMAGTDAKPFTFRGPLLAATAPSIPPRTTKGEPAILETSVSLPLASSGDPRLREILAEANLAWTNVTLYGFEAGAGELRTRIEKGVLAVEPFELPMNEGKLRLAPKFDIAKTPMTVTLEPGTAVDHVRITPEMCRTWLKYIAPLVADATAAEGQLSVALQNANFPIEDPMNGDVQGQLLVHTAQIGPGPLAQQLLTVAQQVRMLLERRAPGTESQISSRWLQVPEQQVTFQLADRRVYHRDLQMVVKDIVIRTQGWVAEDQQIGMIAEVPVQDEWIAKDRYLASLKGQTIKLPISGTLSRPQIDQRALAELSKQAVRDAGTNFLQDQFNKQLERGIDRLLPGALPKNTPPPNQPQP